MEYGEGRIEVASMRFVAVYSTQLAQQHEQAHGQAQAREAEGLAEHIAQVHGRRFACEADAATASAEYAGRSAGRPAHAG